MGEVYRADDLKLGQPVALKFLPASLSGDADRLARFFGEVRIARQVTHPHVCRAYDIGEVDGQHYLSMEYIDGEDLATLLRRIGRLPRDKTVQMARQLCAGLAAEIRGLEVHSGTPAYMAPEQLAGREVSIRSDLYSLGLVLYELFTGRPPFEASSAKELRRLQSQSTPASPSSFVEGFDPAVERVLLRCLQREPDRRPASALAVAAALPGGDPLAAALAAGETPSPAMVAAAGEQGGLHPAVAVACVAFIIAAFAATVYLGRGMPEVSGVLGGAPLAQPPVVLAQKAREILPRLGYEEPPVDSAFGFAADSAYLRWIENHDESVDRWKRLQSGRPPAVYFWYRQSPRLLVPRFGPSATVSQRNPEQVFSGEIRLDLDGEGRLRWLRVVPPQVEESTDAAGEADWQALFAAAGLDPGRFRPAQPVWSPPVFADRRAAWDGTYAGQPDLPVHIEAASFRGLPVFFHLVHPWDRPLRRVEPEARPGSKTAALIVWAVILALMVGAVLLTRRNLRLGRGDRSGAFQIALFVLLIGSLQWVLDASHVPSLVEEIRLFFGAFPTSVFLGATDPRMVPIDLAINLAIWTAVYILLSRFGVLSVCALFFFLDTIQMAPSMDFSAWYASSTFAILVTIAAVIGFGFYTSLAGRSLFGEMVVPPE